MRANDLRKGKGVAGPRQLPQPAAHGRQASAAHTRLAVPVSLEPAGGSGTSYAAGGPSSMSGLARTSRLPAMEAGFCAAEDVAIAGTSAGAGPSTSLMRPGVGGTRRLPPTFGGLPPTGRKKIRILPASITASAATAGPASSATPMGRPTTTEDAEHMLNVALETPSSRNTLKYQHAAHWHLTDMTSSNVLETLQSSISLRGRTRQLHWLLSQMMPPNPEYLAIRSRVRQSMQRSASRWLARRSFIPAHPARQGTTLLMWVPKLDWPAPPSGLWRSGRGWAWRTWLDTCSACRKQQGMLYGRHTPALMPAADLQS